MISLFRTWNLWPATEVQSQNRGHSQHQRSLQALIGRGEIAMPISVSRVLFFANRVSEEPL